MMKSNDTFNIGNNLKSVCIGTTALKIISIPIALVTAELLSNIATQATSGNVPSVISDSLIVLTVIIASMIIRTGADTAIRKKQAMAINKCRVDFLGILLKNPLSNLFKADQGEINENLNDDITTSSKRYSELIPSIIFALLAVVLYMVFLSAQSFLVAITLLAISLLQLLPPLIVKKFMQISYDECRNIEAKITNHISEAVNGYEMIKLYSLKQWWQAKMAGLHKIYLHVGRKADAVAAAQRSMYRVLDNILKYGTYALMGIYVMLGYCTLDVVVEAVYLSNELFAGVKALFSTIPQFAVSRNANKRLEKWMSDDCAGEKMEEKLLSDADAITFNGLHYGYLDNEVIDGVSYRLDASKNYLLRGANGSGKTTLLNLLTGLILPTGGEIMIGNSEASHLNDDAYPKSIFYIPQNDPKFGFSAEALFGMFDEALREKVLSIAKRFELKDDNLTCAISNLSGGERKKVFLSIGFAICPCWLLLDEPSNNLDAHGKDVLCDLIHQRRGSIVISHDPMLCQTAEHTLELKDGRLRNEEI